LVPKSVIEDVVAKKVHVWLSHLLTSFLTQ